MRDRYEYETQRQNMGLPCSECGSHWGHFYFCSVFKHEVLGEAYEQAKPYMGASTGRIYMEPELLLNTDDLDFLKEMKISL